MKVCGLLTLNVHILTSSLRSTPHRLHKGITHLNPKACILELNRSWYVRITCCWSVSNGQAAADELPVSCVLWATWLGSASVRSIMRLQCSSIPVHLTRNTRFETCSQISSANLSVRRLLSGVCPSRQPALREGHVHSDDVSWECVYLGQIYARKTVLQSLQIIVSSCNLLDIDGTRNE